MTHQKNSDSVKSRREMTASLLIHIVTRNAQPTETLRFSRELQLLLNFPNLHLLLLSPLAATLPEGSTSTGPAGYETQRRAAVSGSQWPADPSFISAADPSTAVASGGN
ncbi:hypothetical protein AAFF_G00405380 [Aldrovandia affinis]|uniref:Uncharacterized protein n=1 Tax=Aldrovandia affinis TaxID=143900 RepID=A0AAD7WK45_9TELE|nr:hypothetical protein AAFF_G00405380 [Aldrovandia affinis]